MKIEWKQKLSEEFEKGYFKELSQFIDNEYASKIIHPSKENLYAIFDYLDYSEVKVVVLGQDPYHQMNQAHGLSFSVQWGVKIPPSLLNIYKELKADCGCNIPTHGYLQSWVNQGVFLLNSILTVEDSKPMSHANKGWEEFTDQVITLLNERDKPIVFVLWGKYAQTKKARITNPLHLVCESAHPSPLSAYRGFFGSKPFSTINAFLINNNHEPVKWQIEEYYVDDK